MRRILGCSLRTIVIAVAIVVVARAIFFTTYRVSGTSMKGVLDEGSRILVLRSFPEWLVRRGDIVVCTVEGETLVKRVVACPSDTIAMRSGVVVVNGAAVHEHIAPERQCRDSFPAYRLRSQEYFLLGDNRRISIDSREFGPVDLDQLAGIVLFRATKREVAAVYALTR
jgi:signal peptidase I